MSTHHVRLMSSCTMLLLVGASGRSAAQAAAVSLPGNVVDVQAAEFFFVAPDTIAAGVTTFRLLQTGMLAARLKAGVTGRALVADKGDDTRGFHMLWVVRLDSGKTVADLFRAARTGERRTPWARQMGGAASAHPPLTTNATIDLEPGRYALVCYVGSAREDRSRYHLMHGMARSLTVVTKAGPRAPAPKVDVVATITGEGVVAFSKPVRAGRTVFRVQNDTDREWEFKFQRVPDGMNGVAFLAQTAESGPGVPVGGLSTSRRGDRSSRPSTSRAASTSSGRIQRSVIRPARWSQ